ncbi:flagellar protein FlgN [Paenisporosarcina quisquiliarum]|uniref:Flagellar protein FlgN n=1 Tax=Paenisporosarcina quisquiliarum TaxID=365346 RepID=A0A9X3LFC3_9BACL|nr:flagellar protein FlgN [Paenisporosarcina quisquiliarum]MCZ8536921.1 flagellar protein FlgN [Paenisporosarcina quisquiliarum]
MLQLVTTLEELMVILKQLINLAERKKVVLIERKVDELNQLVQEEAKIVKQLNQVDQEREQLVESALQNHPSLSFSQFVEQLPNEFTRKNLQSKLKTLQQLMMELHDINKVNERLVEDSVNFVQHMIEHITKSKQQHFNYQSPNQQKSQTSNRGFFDTKA